MMKLSTTIISTKESDPAGPSVCPVYIEIEPCTHCIP